MSEEIKDSQEETKLPSKEELAARKKELQKFYADELPLLRKQAEYEQLITEIDVAKFTRFEIMMQKAHIMQGPPEKQVPVEKTQKDPEEYVRPVNNETEKRKLKKQE